MRQRLHSARELQDVPPRVLAGRARAAYRPASSPAPGRRSARRLRCLAVLLHAMCAEPRRHPMEEKRQLALAHIGVTGRFREAGGSASAAGGDTAELVSVGGSDHRDWLSAHSAVRRATISFFCCIFERGRDMPQHARLGRCALVGGGERKWHSRGEVKSRKRAPVVLLSSSSYLRRLSQQRATRRARPSRELAVSWSL